MSVSSLLLCIIIIWDHFSAYCKIMRNEPKKKIRCFVLLWQALIISRKYHISKLKNFFHFWKIKIRNCVSQHQLPFCMWRLFQDSATNLWCLKRRLVFPQFLDSFHTYMAKLYKYILCNSSSKWAKIQEKWFSLLAAQLNGPSLLCGHFGKRCAILWKFFDYYLLYNICGSYTANWDASSVMK